MQNISSASPVADWERIIHKNVRTSDNVAHGKIIAIPDNTDTVIITSQGSRGEYEIPKSAVTGFNGAEVFLNMNTEELRNCRIRGADAYEAAHDEVIEDTASGPQKAKTTEVVGAPATTIPVVEERLKVSKQTRQDEAAIIKEPVVETRTVEVPVTHEELRIEKRPSTDVSTESAPVSDTTRYKVHVSREDVEVRKEPYVKEEVVVKKKPVTETRTVTDTVTKEKVGISGSEKL
jgi:uncharacterized protein (TIGR02271 family)